MFTRLCWLALCALLHLSAHAKAPLRYEAPQQRAFFDQLSTLCGKAFEGKLTVDTPDSKTFSDKRLIMHVRKCSDQAIHIPFHVGEDASRTWIITKTASGLTLKHDHRHSDGSADAMTFYGGHTQNAGWPQAQAFPADQYSKQIFVEQGIPQSIDNTWHIYLYPKSFSYRLVRPGREVRVDFDLTQPVTPPPAPWGHAD